MTHGFLRRLLCAVLCAALVLGSLAFADSVQGAENYRTLTYGIRSDSADSTAVKAMQNRLKELGFLSRKTESTGGYWDSTADAVAAFQQAAGLIVNGKVASPETQAAMFASNAIKADGSTMSAPTPVTYTTSLSRSSAYSKEVKDMQRRLKDLGYLSDKADGSYGANTALAVGAFQKAAGLPVNPDVASAETLTALFSSSAPKAGATMAPAVTETAKTDTTPTPAPTNATTPAPASAIYKDLSKSSSYNKAVKDMQRRLKELGYLNDKADGYYGTNTGMAVSAFQMAAGLPVNPDVASAQMQAVLFSAAAPKVGATLAPTLAPGTTATPTPAPTPVTYTTLSYGMNNNSAVRALQDRLKALGYFVSDSTGNYYGVTKSAVAAFQTAAKLPVAGNTASIEMQKLLFSDSAPRVGTTIAPTASPTPTPTPDPKATATPTPSPTPSPTPVAYTTLSWGMEKSAAVTAMQDRLRALGYFHSNSTGGYYDATKKAVQAFMKACHMTGDGKTASVEMQKLLFSDEAPREGTTLPTAAPTATPTPAPTNKSSDKYTNLTYGTKSSQQVLNAQIGLIRLAFLTDYLATASYDDQTAAAVAAFQEYYGYTVDGKTLTAEQQELLFTEGTREQLLAIRKGEQVTPTTAPTTTPTTAPVTDYSAARTDITLYKGKTGEQVTLLTTRLIELGYLTGEPKSTFDDSVTYAVKWFQNSNSLSADGVAGNATLTKLYKDSVIDAAGSMQAKPDTVPTETPGTAYKPNIKSIQTIAWGNDTYFNRKTGVFKDGATATVTDVATGISYKVKRRGGYNHADVEPLTAYDTWQMYRIYNNTWAWTRRAVVVTFSNGVSSAASINGMPHGASSITDNNMDGHTCIHFEGSHTHQNDNLDPEHQKAVANAASTSLSELQTKINAQ